MAAPQQQHLSSIREPDVEGSRLLTTVLQQDGITCALWGVSAAAHYGAGLCPLDIEIAVNAADQPRVFDLLLSHGLSISTSSQQNGQPASLKAWYESASSFSEFHDRRKTRLLTPIYELPATGNPLNDMLRPYIIVYSAEELGFPLISPSTSTSETNSTAACVPLSVLNPDLASKDSETSPLRDSMIPSFGLLVKSEMHVLLMRAEPHSPVWGQHMAQLSELVHSRACAAAGGLDNLEEVVADAKLNDFISWFRANIKGGADYERLESLRASYRETYL